MQPVGAQSDLTVRQHERVECDLLARVSLAAVHVPVVRLSRLAPSLGGAIPAHLVDVSRGGIGLKTLVYLPARCQIQVEFEAPVLGSATGVRMQVLATVRRVIMADRTPTYYLGVSFQQMTPELEQRVNSMMIAIRSGMAPVTAGGGGGA